MKISALVPTLMLGATLALPASVHAQQHFVWGKCQVDEVATFSNRVHVRCAGNAGVDYAVRYLASPTSNSAEATRLVTLGTASIMSARGNLWILLDLTGDASSYGCATMNCKRPIEIYLQK